MTCSSCLVTRRGAKMDFMKRNNFKNKLRLSILIIFGCVAGLVLWLSVSPNGGLLTTSTNQTGLVYAGEGKKVVRPEIDLRIPENTEIALFALG